MDERFLAPRERIAYTDAERRFSHLLQERLRDVLQGKRNDLHLLRKYPDDPDRLGVMTLPDGIQRTELRIAVVEGLITEAMAFVSPGEQGGPIAQRQDGSGALVESQTYSTKFPHIVIERTDRYRADSPLPTHVTWRLSRLQNQRAQTQINRVLDAANLAFELVRLVR